MCLLPANFTTLESVEAGRSRSAQSKQRSDRNTQRGAQRTRITSFPSGSTPLHHGSSSGSRPALRRINFGLTPRSLSWEYTVCALGLVDLYSLDGNHVTAAGDHGTEQVRLSDRREQSASRQQKGTSDASL